jgi:NTP pyrophosphatase (non-canonical NTP hydrolase)
MKESPTSAYVLAFADRMEAKMSENRHKGGSGNWMSDTPEALFLRLVEEVGEVAAKLGTASAEDISDELADVANFCMMLADRLHG